MGLDSLAPERKHDHWSYSAAFLLPILHSAPAQLHIPRSAIFYTCVTIRTIMKILVGWLKSSITIMLHYICLLWLKEK